MSRNILSRVNGILLVLTAFFLSGCDVLEYLFESDSSSYDPGSSEPINPEPQPVLAGYNAIFEITGFTCYNGEEDDYITSTGQDEITFIYTIIQTDQYGNAVVSSSSGWGPYDIVAGDSYDSQYFEDLTISQIPVGHGVITIVTIVEIEDYSEAQSVMDKINSVADYVEMANVFNPEPYSKAGIEILGEVLYYSGIALDVIDWADDDDLLADQVDVGDPNLVYSTLLGGGYLYNGWVFSGENNTDYFEYEVNYLVHLQPIYR